MPNPKTSKVRALADLIEQYGVLERQLQIAHEAIADANTQNERLEEQLGAVKKQRDGLRESVLGLFDYAVDNGPKVLQEAIGDILDAYPANNEPRDESGYPGIQGLRALVKRREPEFSNSRDLIPPP